MYEEGHGVSKDYKTAVKWHTLAAKQNNAFSQNQLGGMYKKGLGVPQNHKTAAVWYRAAAEQGYAAGQVNLGIMYFIGAGVQEDYVIANMWGTLAASKEDEMGARLKSDVEQFMTPSQIEKSQDLARECIRKKYKGC